MKKTRIGWRVNKTCNVPEINKALTFLAGLICGGARVMLVLARAGVWKSAQNANGNIPVTANTSRNIRSNTFPPPSRHDITLFQWLLCIDSSKRMVSDSFMFRNAYW